ncbi:MAG: hypothetical protein HY074_04340 [Deltaproteobacteria bacterium]|nr:hypothetical protein [Deltaproteobacteria bacterium]
MKILNVSILALLVAASAMMAGCGKSNNDVPASVNGVVASNGSAIPIPGVGATMPVGCYNNGSSACAPCPMGYTQNGTSCTSQNGTGCTAGAWNGYGCMPSGMGCQTGGSWSYQYGGCLTAGYGTYGSSYGAGSGYTCGFSGSAYVCYYTNGAPAAGYYYNGYGWIRYQ